MLNKLEQEIMWMLKDEKEFHTAINTDSSIHTFSAEPTDFDSACKLANRLIAKARALYTNEELHISRDTWAGMGEVQWMRFTRAHWHGKWNSSWEVSYTDSEAGVPSVWVAFYFKGKINERYVCVRLNVYD